MAHNEVGKVLLCLQVGSTFGCWDVGLEGGSQEEKETSTQVTDSLKEGLSGQ